jgi:hypothetical protein
LVSREAGVDGVCGIRELEVEAVLGPEGFLIEVYRYDVSDLDESSAVVPNGVVGPIFHTIKKFLDNSWCQGCHVLRMAAREIKQTVSVRAVRETLEQGIGLGLKKKKKRSV